MGECITQAEPDSKVSPSPISISLNHNSEWNWNTRAHHVKFEAHVTCNCCCSLKTPFNYFLSHCRHQEALLINSSGPSTAVLICDLLHALQGGEKNNNPKPVDSIEVQNCGRDFGLDWTCSHPNKSVAWTKATKIRVAVFPKAPWNIAVDWLISKRFEQLRSKSNIRSWHLGNMHSCLQRMSYFAVATPDVIIHSSINQTQTSNYSSLAESWHVILICVAQYVLLHQKVDANRIVESASSNLPGGWRGVRQSCHYVQMWCKSKFRNKKGSHR